MSVRTITARRNRKTGRVAITFEIDPETWANMGRSARESAHPDTLDYVAGRINAAFVEDESPREAGPVGPGADDDGIPF